jgi:DNA-binding transcriptional MerR regulator
VSSNDQETIPGAEIEVEITERPPPRRTRRRRAKGTGGIGSSPLKDVLEQEEAPPSSNVPDKLYFRIGEVAQLVGVDAHVLRYWESEFKMKPHRSNSGQRLYRKQDLSRFLKIKHLLHDEGYTIAGARKVLSGGSAGAPTIDADQLREAARRIQGLRDLIAEYKDELLEDG